MLSPVDKLQFLVLVDNNVEWISSVPPGFMLELPQHLFPPTPDMPKPPIDALTGLPFVDLDNYCCGAHGLSILLTTTIDGKQYNVLLDGGPERNSIERNAQAMSVRLDKLDAIVLSHWHRDHSGGIVRALEMRQEMALQPLDSLTVDLHPEKPIRRGIAPLPKKVPMCALPVDPTIDDIEAAGGKVEYHDEDHEILGRDGQATGIGVSGEIPRVTPFEVGLPGAITWMIDENGEGGWFTDELIKDERYVVVDVKGKGLVIFSSCSHAGICNVISDAIAKYQRPIHMVVGGLHLVPAHQQPVNETIDFLTRRVSPRPTYIVPLHCTGMVPKSRLQRVFGDKCVAAGVGLRAVVDGEERDNVGRHRAMT